MLQILIVDDDASINHMMVEVFEKNGYACTQAFSGTEALLLLERTGFDLMILDLMLPGMSGQEVLRQVRARWSLPVIVVSARDELDSKVELLSCGADDYVTKPFAIQELLVRATVQLRKQNKSGGAARLTCGALSLDKEAFSVTVDGTEVPLTRQEFKILELLMTYPERVFSKEAIYEYAWDHDYLGEDKTINVHISNIRQKLKKVRDEKFVDTIWGIGFKLHT